MFKKIKIKGVIMNEAILLFSVIIGGFVVVSLMTHVLNRSAE